MTTLRETTNRLPNTIIWAIIAICTLPFLLHLLGFDFGNVSHHLDPQAAGAMTDKELQKRPVRLISGRIHALFAGVERRCHRHRNSNSSLHTMPHHWQPGHTNHRYGFVLRRMYGRFSCPGRHQSHPCGGRKRELHPFYLGIVSNVQCAYPAYRGGHFLIAVQEPSGPNQPQPLCVHCEWRLSAGFISSGTIVCHEHPTARYNVPTKYHHTPL